MENFSYSQNGIIYKFTVIDLPVKLGSLTKIEKKTLVTANPNMYYTNLISNNFSKYKQVKKIIDNDFNFDLVKKLFDEKPSGPCVDTFLASCYFGKKDILNYILQTVNFEKSHSWAFFGGIKIACYGKQLEILHILFNTNFAITDEKCKHHTGQSLTAFLADAILRRFYENSECVHEIFNTAFISSIIYKTVCAYCPIDENWIENRYTNDPNWLELKKTNSKNLHEHKILVCNFRKKTGSKISIPSS
jgi:hypothetical protein